MDVSFLLISGSVCGTEGYLTHQGCGPFQQEIPGRNDHGMYILFINCEVGMQYQRQFISFKHVRGFSLHDNMVVCVTMIQLTWHS